MTASTEHRRVVAITDLPSTRGFAEAQEVLRSPRFASAMHSAHTYEIFGQAVLTLEGAEHRSRRHTERELFADRARAAYESIVARELAAALDAAESAATGDHFSVEITSLVRPIFLKVTARIVGIDDVESTERAEELMEIVTGLRGVAGSDFISGDKGEAVRRAVAVKQLFVDGFFAESKATRLGLIASGAEIDESTADLLTLLLKHYPDWTDDQYVRECLFFLAASGGTQLNAIGHAVVELEAWIGEDPERAGRLLDRAFLQRAIAESMRHHPPLPKLVRRAVRDVALPGGASFAEGDEVAVDLFSANFDEDVWGSDAARFDPDREVPVGVLEHGVTFALGPHTCPGRPVAIGDRTKDGEVPPWGVVTQILGELYRRGARLDPDRPPVPSDEYVFPIFAEVTVRMPRDAG